MTPGFLESKQLDSRIAVNCRSFVENYGLNVDSLARWIVARHGVPLARQYLCDDLIFWYSRFDLPSGSNDGLPIMDEETYSYFSSCADFILSTYSLIYCEDSEYDDFIKRLTDKLKSEV